MSNNEITIDVVKLAKYILKRIWLPALLAVICFGLMYWRAANHSPKTYTAYGTMYVFNGNPNLVNYQYASIADLDTAVQLIDTYMIVVRSNKVMDVIVERLIKDYPGIQPGFVSSSLSMASVAETGVVRVSSVTSDPQLSADICNAVLDVAPAEIVRVVGAGSVEVIDYATVPMFPDSNNPKRKGIVGGAVGGLLGCAILLILFLVNRRISDVNELIENYTPPVLSSILRQKNDNADAGYYLLTRMSPMEVIESYARLRMNLFYTLVGKDSRAVVVTSAIPGEGKSTIAANLAISCCMSGKKVLLVDSDLRRACQKDIFGYDKHAKGLSEALVGECKWQDLVIKNLDEELEVLPAGHLPPNPTELLESKEMNRILEEMEENYDLVILDLPPVNVVTDPLALSQHVTGCLFVVREDFSDHNDLKRALNAAEMTGMSVLGFVFYGEKVNQSGYYRRRYQKRYYSKYDYRNNPDAAVTETDKKL